MFKSCIAKQNLVKDLFKDCPTAESRYSKIMELGRQLPKVPEIHKIPENLVKGCQSQMYLHAYMENGNVIFEAESDALISAGLAALLVMVYSGESPEAVLKYPPTYLEELGINASLSPSRANGLHSMHLRMKQEALKLLIKNTQK